MPVVLVEPQIATNTGNIIRLCANTGVGLHLVEPLGFDLDDAKLRRSGLDYHEHATVTIHQDVAAARAQLTGRWFAFSASAERTYADVEFAADDVLAFGTERTGLAADVLVGFEPDHVLTIPMMPDNRSLNLANAVAIVVYEAWRQRSFAGAAARPLEGLTSETLTEPPDDT